MYPSLPLQKLANDAACSVIADRMDFYLQVFTQLTQMSEDTPGFINLRTELIHRWHSLKIAFEFGNDL